MRIVIALTFNFQDSLILLGFSLTCFQECAVIRQEMSLYYHIGVEEVYPVFVREHVLLFKMIAFLVTLALFILIRLGILCLFTLFLAFSSFFLQARDFVIAFRGNLNLKMTMLVAQYCLLISLIFIYPFLFCLKAQAIEIII